MNKNKDILTYKDAGVDIESGNLLVDNISDLCKETHRPETLSNLGGFAAFSEIPKKYKDPILVSGTDGVGTKLELLSKYNRHATAGNDLVAMCINDILVCGAEPLFFLDYIATGKLEIDQTSQVISGIAKACKASNCALIGGETAEMPGMYLPGSYDLAGFCVGVVEKSALITSDKMQSEDILIGIPSSGPHSNGYSLIRKILEKYTPPEDILENILQPTHIYTEAIHALLSKVPIHGMAHITGGGLIENIPRLLPPSLKAVLDLNSWKLPKTFEWLQTKANLPIQEMYTTFNCGIGLVMATPPEHLKSALAYLETFNLPAIQIGHIERADATTSATSQTLTLHANKAFEITP